MPGSVLSVPEGALVPGLPGLLLTGFWFPAAWHKVNPSRGSSTRYASLPISPARVLTIKISWRWRRPRAFVPCSHIKEDHGAFILSVAEGLGLAESMNWKRLANLALAFAWLPQSVNRLSIGISISKTPGTLERTMLELKRPALVLCTCPGSSTDIASR